MHVPYLESWILSFIPYSLHPANKCGLHQGLPKVWVTPGPIFSGQGFQGRLGEYLSGRVKQEDTGICRVSDLDISSEGKMQTRLQVARVRGQLVSP